jgi:hypothetical protein
MVNAVFGSVTRPPPALQPMTCVTSRSNAITKQQRVVLVIIFFLRIKFIEWYGIKISGEVIVSPKEIYLGRTRSEHQQARQKLTTENAKGRHCAGLSSMAECSTD